MSTLQDAVIFGQVASNETFFTGLALLNPNDMAVMAMIEVFDRNGDLVISKVETIAAGRRLSQVLTQYFPALDGVDISSGYIKVTIDKGVASFALFGARDLSVLSAVPPAACSLASYSGRTCGIIQIAGQPCFLSNAVKRGHLL